VWAERRIIWVRSQNSERQLLASSCLSVYPSIRTEQFDSHWADFSKILYMSEYSSKIFLRHSKHTFYVKEFFSPENVLKCKNIAHPERPQITIQQGACALYATYSTLEKHAQNL